MPGISAPDLARNDSDTPVPASQEDLKELTRQLEQPSSQGPLALRYSVDSDTDRVVFKVVDPQTNKVILQVPPEEALALAKRLKNLAQGDKPDGLLMDTLA